MKIRTSLNSDQRNLLESEMNSSNPKTIVEAKMAIHSIYTLFQDDPEARNWLSFFRGGDIPADQREN